MSAGKSEVVALTPAALKEHLFYDPDTGVFTWLSDRRNGSARPGTAAGSVNGKGYRTIWVCGKSYRANRLAFLYMTGSWPVNQADHINGDRLDNRWENLRDATNSQNCMNQGPRKDNKSGHKGVRWYHQLNRWEAQLRVNGKNKRLGYFTDKDEAIAAYRKACVDAFGEFAKW